MKVQLIRNATLRVEYADKIFLIDPYLAEKGTYAPVKNTIRQDIKNPATDLPLSIDEIIADIDAVILTHLHLDHYDSVAQKVLPANIPIFVQNESDQERVQNDGFTNVEILQEVTDFEGVTLSKTVGEHGRGEILKTTGQVCGVVFTHSSENSLYIAGDTVWYEGVHKELKKYNPAVVVVNAGDNQFLQGGPIIMNKEDIYALHLAAPETTILAVHMEAVNHWMLSRKELRDFIIQNELSDKVFVPSDGESMTF